VRRTAIGLRLTFLLALACTPLAAPAPALGQAPGNGAGSGERALIRPGDVVRLVVWREESLTGEFPVNQFGTVVLPMLGEYDVTSETHRSFRERVIRDFEPRVVTSAIEVTVLKRVRVLGEVNEPGVYLLDPTMTVADAIAMAKGHTPLARDGRVELRRDGSVVDADLRVETPVTASLIQSGDELLVPRRSWLDRNAAAVIGGASALVGLMVTLIVN